MLTRIYTATTLGLEPIKIEVEIDANRGKPDFIIIGLPSKTLDEAKERITSALRNCDVRIRSKRTIVNLAPADIKKTSPVFELAIAVGLLKMYGEITTETDDTIFFGELSLDGELKKIRGALPLILAAKEMGFKKVILPAANSAEVSVITGIEIYPLQSLHEYLAANKAGQQLTPLKPQAFDNLFQTKIDESQIDLSDIHGQESAKKALEIAAAGGHNLLMVGPPGAGKSMLAQALISILPPLTQIEAIEASKIYSVCGLSPNEGLILKRPFRSPHHSTSQVGLIGGGSDLHPGEISLSHRGILFLDEFPEFTRSSLEALRQPLETGEVVISRASGSAKYPSRFTLIAAANPCPCGYYGSLKKNCICTPYFLEKYQKKLSGPILDRIDLYVAIDDVEVKKLVDHDSKGREQSIKVRERVQQAREIQRLRFAKTKYLTNSELTSKDVKKLMKLTDGARGLLKQAVEKLGLSARSYFKIIKVSQTIADLAGEKIITNLHVAQALQYRQQRSEV